MKKIAFPIACLFLLASCHQEGVRSYHIAGTIDEAEDGTIVMLQVDKEQSLEVLATTEVKKHQFAFSGVQDSTIECNVTYLQRGHKVGAAFFLENGHIQMNLSNETSHITGTPNNDRYQQFLNKINVIYAQIGSAYDEIPEEEQTTVEQENELKNKVDALKQKASELVFSTITENINNPVGYHLFCRFSQNLSASQQEEILKRLPASYKRTTAIEDIRSLLSILPPDSTRTDSIDYGDLF